MALKFKWVWALVLIPALVLGLAACGGDGDKVTDGTQTSAPAKGAISKDTLLKKVSELNTGFRTCELVMDMTMSMEGWDGEEEEEISMEIAMNGSAAMDLPAKKMKMIMDMTMDVPEEMQDPEVPESITMEMYMMDNTMYMNMGEEFGGWMKMAIPESEWGTVWEQQDIMNQQTDLLLSAYNVEIVGEKTVNGVKCYEVTMEPDLKQVMELFGAQMGDYMPDEMDASDIEEAMDMIKNLSIRQWYDKETFLPVRAEMSLSFEDEGENTTVDMSMEMNMKYSRVNKPVTIELPEEAKGAVNLGEWSETVL